MKNFPPTSLPTALGSSSSSSRLPLLPQQPQSLGTPPAPFVREVATPGGGGGGGYLSLAQVQNQPMPEGSKYLQATTAFPPTSGGYVQHHTLMPANNRREPPPSKLAPSMSQDSDDEDDEDCNKTITPMGEVIIKLFDIPSMIQSASVP